MALTNRYKSATGSGTIAALILVLVFRPQGLFGEAERVRA